MEGVEGFCVADAGGGAEGDERPKGSFDAVAVAGFEVAFGGLEAKLKSPKSSMGILSGFDGCVTTGDGFGAAAGFAAGLGVVSKKPPPLNEGDVTCGGAAAERCLLELLKLANGSALGY